MYANGVAISFAGTYNNANVFDYLTELTQLLNLQELLHFQVSELQMLQLAQTLQQEH
jgi:hypothetical protein